PAEDPYGATVCATIQYVTAEMNADAGMVRIHAQTMRPATPQRTADSRLIEPTPMMAPVIVCVVLTGTPRWVAVKSEIAPAVSAANPPTGVSLVIRDPMVWMIRQPPDSVPRAIAACAAMMIQKGMGRWPSIRSR